MTEFYIYNPETLEVAGSIECSKWNAPRNSFKDIDILADKDGYAVTVILDNGNVTDTKYIEDNRGKTIFDISDCTVSKTVTKLGKIEEGFTLSKPSSQFDIWDDINNNWQLDTQKKYEHDYQVVNNTRESLYVEMVDRLRNEARSIREIENDEEKALNYESQANAAYLKIREDNPWPAVPTI